MKVMPSSSCPGASRCNINLKIAVGVCRGHPGYLRTLALLAAKKGRHARLVGQESILIGSYLLLAPDYMALHDMVESELHLSTVLIPLHSAGRLLLHTNGITASRHQPPLLALSPDQPGAFASILVFDYAMMQ